MVTAILTSDEFAHAAAHLFWLGVMAGLLRHERWHRPKAIAVWEMWRRNAAT